MSSELRIDPEDWQAYTYSDLKKYYKSKYSAQDIAAYWDKVCKPFKSGKGAAKSKDKPKPPKKKPDEPKAEEVPMPAEATGLCVCGEALIDFLPSTTAAGDDAFRGVCGGSPFNCCIAAQRLGMPVTYLGAISKDLFGEKLCKHLSDEGVDMSATARVDRPTTLAFVVRAAGEGEKYAFFKENAADRALSIGDVRRACTGKRFKAVHMSLGAVTLEEEKMAKAFRQLYIRAGKDMGALRTFDPNLRPNMVASTPEKYRAKVEKLLKVVDVVKTSIDDIEFLYGEGVELPKITAAWLKTGPKLVVVTLGSKGATAFYTPAEAETPTTITVEPPGERPNTVGADGKSCPVVDTVGAGDTFMGGLITGCLGSGGSEVSLLPQLVEGAPWAEPALTRLKEVMQRSAVSAAITCSRAGADPPTASELERALASGS